MDLTALATELQTDPVPLGYAARIQARDDGGAAALLNAATGPGAGTVARGRVPLDDPAVASLLAYALPRIAAITDQARKDTYTLLVQTINAVGALYTTDANVQAVMTQAVTDSVVTPQLAAAVASRIGSRAEVLWGAGTVVEARDIGRALGR